MRVILSPRAERQLKKLSKVNQIIIAKKIRELGSKKTSGEEKLKGYQNIFRVRIGDLRIVYKSTKKEIYIVLIGHRKDIYKLLSRLFS